jgi:hypothetical protein
MILENLRHAMGGFNSGRWHWYTPRTTVESTYSLSVGKLIRLLSDRDALTHIAQSERSVTYSWYQGERKTGSIGVSFCNFTGNSPHFLLTYAVNSTNKTERVYLNSTAQNLGGSRWWFTCPDCSRRCGSIYLSGSCAHFACRVCHRLTYSSVQTAHNYDRGIFAELGKLIMLEKRYGNIINRLSRCHFQSKNYHRQWLRLEGLERDLHRSL